MPDDGGTGQDSGSQGQGSETGQGAGTDQGSENQGLTLEQALAALQDARTEAGKYRVERNALDAKVKEYEKATLSEQEKLQRERDEALAQAKALQAQVQASELRAAITAQAMKLGFRNPGLAHRLVDPNGVDWDDKGQPTNVKALLEQLLKDDPYLAGTSSGADAGAGRGQGAGGKHSMNDVIRAAATGT